jgi:hypothetical protein
MLIGVMRAVSAIACRRFPWLPQLPAARAFHPSIDPRTVAARLRLRRRLNDTCAAPEALNSVQTE